MYTGITHGLFAVSAVERAPGLLTYSVALTATLATGLACGDSVAIDGVCQTVVAIQDHTVTFNAIAETLAKTTLQDLQRGQFVSVERSLCLGDELGGHELAGHVFETGSVVTRQADANNLKLGIKCSQQCIRFIFEKGYVGIDGSSLTIGQVDYTKGVFDIHLIPATLRLTNFNNKEISAKVNIEIDARTMTITETVERHLADLNNRLLKVEQACLNANG